MHSHLTKIKDCLTRKKVKDFEIYLERSWGTSVEVKDQKLDALENDDALGFGVRVLKDSRMGFSYGTDFSSDAINYVVDQSIASAAHTTQDVHHCFAETSNRYPTIHQWDDKRESLSTQDKIALACDMEKAALDFDKRLKRVRNASFSETAEEILFFVSSGKILECRQTHFDTSLMAVAESSEGSEVAYDVEFSPYWKDLNPKQLGRRTAKIAVQLLGGKRVPSYRGPILLDPYVTVEMLEVLAPSTLAENIHKQNSFLVGKKGKKIYASGVTIIDDGLYPKGVVTFPFDAEGIPSQTTTVIDRGIVQQYLYNSYWAKRDGVTSTGNANRDGPLDPPHMATRNFYLKPGNSALEDLLQEIGQGFLITETIGMHTADPISGDFSVGVQGFAIKNGKKDHAIRSVALTGNLHDLFSMVISVASDLKFYGAIGSPSILVEEASISGQ